MHKHGGLAAVRRVAQFREAGEGGAHQALDQVGALLDHLVGGDDRLRHHRVVHEATRDRLGDRGPREGTDEVERRGHEDRHLWPERARRDRGRDRVRRVMEPVDVVEDDRRDDDADEEANHA